MKKIDLLIFFIAVAITIPAQNVGIGTTSPNTSAILDVNSTSKGLLLPRMAQSQRNAITTPVAGLMIWCNNCGVSGEIQVYNGKVWTNMVGSTAAEVIPSVTISNQVWMSKNLDVTTYKNGDVIPQVTDSAAWFVLNSGAWCYYNNDSATGAAYGKLYNWYAVIDPRGLAPQGWHIPTDAEWTTLTNNLGGASVAGGKMKATIFWNSPNTGATNESGFTGFPGGYRFADANFFDIDDRGYWWSKSDAWEELSINFAWQRILYYDDGRITRNGNHIRSGLSVRCIRD